VRQIIHHQTSLANVFGPFTQPEVKPMFMSISLLITYSGLVGQVTEWGKPACAVMSSKARR
jgi:hypothetical protein